MPGQDKMHGVDRQRSLDDGGVGFVGVGVDDGEDFPGYVGVSKVGGDQGGVFWLGDDGGDVLFDLAFEFFSLGAGGGFDVEADGGRAAGLEVDGVVACLEVVVPEDVR